MVKERFQDVTVVVADPDPRARTVAKKTLIQAGFRKILTGHSLSFVRESFDIEMPELLIAETELPDGDFTEFVSDLRHHKIGNNPFLVVSALTSNPTPELVKKVIQAGADDLLSKPFDVKTLMRRVGRLIHERKPFVVTGDYVGPTRQAKSQKEANAERFDAPNTLKARALNEGTIDEVQAMVDAAITNVNTKALESHAEDIEELVTILIPRLATGEIDATARLCLDRLRYAAEDANRRLDGTIYNHVSDLCQTLLGIVNSIRNCGGTPGERDVKLLGPLNKAIQLGFDKNADVATARQITQAVLSQIG
ncbi:putative Response regulator consisting of a CheY-like receiver domain [Candidatus Terasakiella magnetica]|uniref:Putative Response regulator consisting of a CheY-like receiver domain n=1 Tax=Candidatus Terasakiella magnetica TaxID=1867952 RepID=A0A1C3RKQ8_9PROT|nr:response regulator [Candidatus Terasakiella magnetica]SCA57811.1 putative Response regulator consisting of a CheY-like receiver domain [Candidatus Terasakiella magnetica]